MANRLDAQSSTSTPLGISATFTGQVSYVAGFTSVTVFLDTDQDCTLKIWQATDGVNFDYLKSYDLDASISTSEIHTVQVIASHMKIELVNGGVAQTHLRLQTILHENYTENNAASTSGVITDSSEATLVRAVNKFDLDVQKGLFSDKQSVRVFGYNEAVPNGTYADIWNYGGTTALYPFPITAETFRIKAGGNVADTAAGAGARSVKLTFLDSTGLETTETLATAGASASLATSSTATRLIKAEVVTSGTIRFSNTADILIENTTSGLIVGVIPAEKGITANAIYTVPLGFTAYMTDLHIEVESGATKDADVHLYSRTNALTFAAPFGAKKLEKEWTSFQGESNIDFHAMPSFPALTDIWIEAKGNGAVTGVEADLSFVLSRN